MPVEVICAGCGGPREIAQEPVLCCCGEIHAPGPGVTVFLPCEACGAHGTVRVDLYKEIHVKKPNRELYERSRYRGGHLR